MLVEPEIQRRVRIGGRDDIPPGAAAADVIERGETAGDMIGLVEGGRAGGDQPDMFGGAGQRRQQRERLERRDGVAALERVDRHVQHGQMVSHEEGVELPGFEFLDQPLDVGEIEIGIRPCAGIAPGAGLNADRPRQTHRAAIDVLSSPHSVLVVAAQEIGSRHGKDITRA